MLDVYSSGTSQRLSPEAPVPVILNPEITSHLGGAAHVVKLLANPHLEIDLFCSLGADEAGDTLRTLLDPLCNIISVEVPMTTVKTRIQVGGHQVCRIDRELVIDVSEQIVSLINPKINAYQAIVISDYAKGAVSKTANFKHPGIFIDPKGDSLENYSGGLLLKPNAKEFYRLFGYHPEMSRIDEIAKSLKRHGIENLLVTRSEQSALLINISGEAHEIYFKIEDVNDVTGAGDVVLAASVLEYLEGFSIIEAASRGIQRSASSVSYHGTGFANYSDIELRRKRIFSDLNEVSNLKKILNENGRKLVVTNGCFDLLHPGHLNTLKYAKSHGDYLLVLINSDLSVKRLKGENRPINNELVRAEMLLNTPNVDGIYVFLGETPALEIQTIIPDVLVKGGDYDPIRVIGYDTVMRNGGKVVVAPYLEGHSTSSIIEKTQKYLD